MRTVHKYPLTPSSWQNLVVTEGYEILHVDTQGEVPTLWVLVNTDKRPTMIRIGIFGTGHPIPDIPIKHLGSTLQHDGQFVWHVFQHMAMPEEL